MHSAILSVRARLRLLLAGITLFFAASSTNADVVLVPTILDGSVSELSLSPAVVTTNEAGMDDVFGAPNFDPGPPSTFIDIQFNTETTAAGPTNIQTEADLFAVFALATGPATTVHMFFVDILDWCGVTGDPPNPGIVGCASTPGNVMVLESAIAAGPLGKELNSHELGHNLDLGHLAGVNTNLMNPSLSGSTALTAEQITTIDGSDLVQGANPNRFITIQPIVVIPEPSTAVPLLLVLMGLTVLRRNRTCR